MMPFKSERQRRWMHANEPEMAARWEAEEGRRDNVVRRAIGPRKRIVVTGSRSDDGSRVRADLDAMKYRHGRLRVAEGGAKGADAAAADWARSKRRVKHKQYLADWAKQHRAAGPIRNRKMIDSERPDVVLAYPGGDRGTADAAGYARKKGYRVVERAPVGKSDGEELLRRRFNERVSGSRWAKDHPEWVEQHRRAAELDPEDRRREKGRRDRRKIVVGTKPIRADEGTVPRSMDRWWRRRRKRAELAAVGKAAPSTDERIREYARSKRDRDYLRDEVRLARSAEQWDTGEPGKPYGRKWKDSRGRERKMTQSEWSAHLVGKRPNVYGEGEVTTGLVAHRRSAERQHERRVRSLRRRMFPKEHGRAARAEDNRARARHRRHALQLKERNEQAVRNRPKGVHYGNSPYNDDRGNQRAKERTPSKKGEERPLPMSDRRRRAVERGVAKGHDGPMDLVEISKRLPSIMRGPNPVVPRGAAGRVMSHKEGRNAAKWAGSERVARRNLGQYTNKRGKTRLVPRMMYGNKYVQRNIVPGLQDDIAFAGANKAAAIKRGQGWKNRPAPYTGG